jgi:L-2-hydroxyglutarate oxidase
MSNHDVVVIGGGIVGLSTALRLKQQRPELKVAVVEKESGPAAHQTGHNSGVIHSGIYYKPGSLKARNCIQGYYDLLEFCQEQHIPFERCGKVIVATRQEQLPALENVFKRGQENGLAGLRHLSAEEVREIEPHCTGIKGIFVPQTGIVDYKVVCERIAKVFQDLGGEVFYNSRVTGISRVQGKVVVATSGGEFHAKLLVNCAGLYCDKIAEMAGLKTDVRIIPFRGEYYALRPEKAYLVKNLIYPVPDPNFPFLGVHFTRRISGEIEAGPNAVLAYRREGYRKSDFHAGELWESLSWKGFRKVAMKYWKTGLGELYRSYSKSAFTRALQELVPEVQESDLEPAGAGVRAQACDREGGLIDDFVIREDEGSIHVLNAPSPAATSGLSIGTTVAALVLKRF